MNYQTLKAGDIRQEGDETMRKSPYEGTWLTHGNPDPYHQHNTWLPVRLLGHIIQSTDLHVSAFRRPLP